MSDKKTKQKKSGRRVAIWIILIVEILVLAAAGLCLWTLNNAKKHNTPDQPQPDTQVTAPAETAAPEFTEPAQAEEIIDTQAYLDKHLQILNLGSYTGIYMEDGTNEVVSGVLMLVVQNYGAEDIQYAEIILPTDSGEAKFSVSTLPAGESCVLLEQNRMAYTGTEDAAKAVSQNVAPFLQPMSLYQEQLKLQILNGAINVTNISGEDISGDVVIYYKNAADDLYYGGITYRVRIEGGLKAEEIKQIMGKHFSETGSKIMFVTVG